MVSDSLDPPAIGDSAEDGEFEVVVGAEVSGNVEVFGNVEVAGWSGASGVCWSWGASSARTKVAEMPLMLAQRTSARQSLRRDLLIRACFRKTATVAKASECRGRELRQVMKASKP